MLELALPSLVTNASVSCQQTPNTTPVKNQSGKNFTSGTPGNIFLRIFPIQVHGHDKTVRTYALLDDCSDISLCKNKLIDKLGIAGSEKSFYITTVSYEGCSKKGKEVCLTV